MRTYLLTATIFLGLTIPCQAFPAIVYAAHDGDTVTLLAGGHLTHCRLAGIDSPELHVNGKWPDQPGAYEAHAALDNMILGQTVDVQDTGQRSFKRMVCRITAVIDGKLVDVNEEMVREGWAWDAVQFEPARDRDPAMASLQAQAQAARVGIWASNSVAPWDWRHERR